MAVDPATGRVFLVTADVRTVTGSANAGQPPTFDYNPGTVHLLILEPTGDH